MAPQPGALPLATLFQPFRLHRGFGVSGFGFCSGFWLVTADFATVEVGSRRDRVKIGRHFSAGLRFKRGARPVGTPENAGQSFERPYGTRIFLSLPDPALKCRAIFVGPYGTDSAFQAERKRESSLYIKTRDFEFERRTRRKRRWRK